MKIPVSDTLLDGEAEVVLPVPLSREQLEWVERKAEARGISKRQFVRFILNKIKQTEDQIRKQRASGKHKSQTSEDSSMPDKRDSEAKEPLPLSSDSVAQQVQAQSFTPRAPRQSYHITGEWDRENDAEDTERSMFDFVADEQNSDYP